MSLILVFVCVFAKAACASLLKQRILFVKDTQCCLHGVFAWQNGTPGKCTPGGLAHVNGYNKIKRTRLLNKLNSHCYLPYCKHDPTTDINTFNATALLIFRLLLLILYTILIN